MTYRTAIEQTSDRRFRATPLSFPDCVAVADTREQALESVREILRERLEKVEFVELQVGENEHPWLKFAGMFKDDPNWDQYLEDIAQYRRSVDEAEATRAEVPA